MIEVKTPAICLLFLCAVSRAPLAAQEPAGPGQEPGIIGRDTLRPALPLGDVLVPPDGPGLERTLWPLAYTAAALARHDQSIVIRLEGHRHVQGSRNESHTWNMAIVLSVAQFLTRYGIAPNRIEAVGYSQDNTGADVSAAKGLPSDCRVRITLTMSRGK